MPSYAKLEGEVTQREEEVLKIWEEQGTFKQSLRQREEAERWVFYEGPPTANGRPHFGHLIPRVYKDLFPRYKTMRGYYVERKGGWDTHGLPVELEVEKELGLNSKGEIERYGIENFIAKCKESVWRYKSEWERMIERLGFWLNLENAYITYTNEYIESVWWALKRIWEEGLLYRGHKVLPYCPRCGTPLSSHEVAQGYRTVKDPSVFVRLPLRGEPHTAFLVWTTTPWTLPANTALAVGPDFAYIKAKVGDEVLILAKERLDVLGQDYETLEELQGTELVGKRYRPPYELLKSDNAYRVVAADFVNLEEGTGIVHIAPAFGEEDYLLSQQEGLELLLPVDRAGRFTAEFPLAAGEFVKDADQRIIQDLQNRGILYRHELYEHEYPFCWRCDTPLLYYALDSYFIKTTARKDAIIESNQRINWYPEHMREGRFGEFLREMKDWALSRNRYWGTPLPVWVCDQCNHELAVGSREELVELAIDREQARQVEPHRPSIDAVVLRCPKCGGEMHRVPYVIDAWFDSGMMHTAQWHYPFENQEKFKEQFPADFISEALDQTRGWFYTLLVTSTLLYGEPAYKNVIVTGLGLDREGKKMSKRLGNMLDPGEVVAQYGADAARWYLYSSSASWKTRRLAAEDVGEALRGPLDRAKNIYNFFALYAGIDQFAPQEHWLAVEQRPLLDRWALSRLHSTIGAVTEALDGFDVVKATQAIERLLDDLSNWFVRSSRRRFWGGGMGEDKRAAYSTLYTVLLKLAKLLAPFVPFLAELVYQGLRTDDLPESVHLCDWPVVDERLIDAELEQQMARARAVVALGHAARNAAGIKVRQPLPRLLIASADKFRWEELLQVDELVQLILNELNVKGLELVDLEAERRRLFQPEVQPKMGVLGPRFGPLAPKIAARLGELDPAEVMAKLDKGGLPLQLNNEEVELSAAEVEISWELRAGYQLASDDGLTVILSTEIDEGLRREGYVRELIHQVQLMRKEAGFEVTDRIALYYEADGELREAIASYGERIKAEVLAISLERGLPSVVEHRGEREINGQQTLLGLVRRQ